MTRLDGVQSAAQLRATCYDKRAYLSIGELAWEGRRAEQRENRSLYYYRCPFGDHWHLSKDAAVTGMLNNPLNMAALLTLIERGTAAFLAVADFGHHGGPYRSTRVYT